MSNPAENLKEKFKKEKIRITQVIRKLKKNTPRDLDYRFQELHDEAFSQIDCLNCANCCKTTSPILLEKDIERLSQHLKIRPGEFITKYLFLDTDNLYAFKSVPCPFLGADNYCTVYEFRPKACREYPHTNQRKMHTLLNLAEKNAEICPAVFHILKRFAE
ncbi:MAG: YkgJ family cysteine cluster protein [Bacteroidetes bacterium]|nr:YkgJ family cysteine cluster protein [Bacteroidota bacterium]